MSKSVEAVEGFEPTQLAEALEVFAVQSVGSI